MKVAFYSNFLNHHQLPLCLALAKNEQVEFSFVACEKIPEDRLQMGYIDMNSAYPFVVRAYEDEEEAKRIAREYDVVIFGASPTSYLKERMALDRLSFRFCERPLKKGTWRRFIPRTAKKIKEGFTAYKDKELYVLCASAYTSGDLALCGFDRNKCFQWGYFPSVCEKNIDELFKLKEENTPPEILYAGRLLKLKRVIDTVKAVEKIHKKGIPVHFTIIGDGEEKPRIIEYIQKHKLESCITLLSFMSPEEVRERMDCADIFVLGSTFYEGWGAVINEAMNSACAVVMSHAVGSAPYLIRNNQNGYIYEMGNVEQLTERLCELVQDNEKRKSFGTSAYRTVTEEWNAETAANRLLCLCENLQSGTEAKLYSEGPCATAPIYKNYWIHREKPL
jgi:glycosyltransferase involved in cell wall biosynthesis